MELTLTKQSFQLFKKAYEYAKANGFDYIQSQDLINAMTEIADSGAASRMVESGITNTQLKESLSHIIWVDASELATNDSSKKVKRRIDFDTSMNDLDDLDSSSTPLKLAIEPLATEDVVSFRQFRFSEPTAKILSYANDINIQNKNGLGIETYWILYSIMQVPQSNGYRIIDNLTDTFYFRGSGHLDYYRDGEWSAKEKRNNELYFRMRRDNHFSIIDDYLEDLTQAACEGLIQPVYGREIEIQALALALTRRDKNNAVLLGPGGVGKSAIIDGLALKIANHEIPSLMYKRILKINLMEIASEAVFTSDFFVKLLQEMQDNPDVILFMDEIHVLANVPRITNYLKPAMARSGFRIIGATTPNEWKMSIALDSALSRRFEKINVAEPSIDEAIHIVKKVAPNYEKYHRVHFPPALIEKIVQLSKQYLTTEYLPDSAITLLDDVGALVNFNQPNPALMAYQQKRHQLKEQLQQAEYDFDDDKVTAIQEKMVQLQKDLTLNLNQQSDTANYPTVTLDQIIQVLETKSGLPKENFVNVDVKMTETSLTDIKDIRQKLNQQIIGQEAATNALADAVMRSKTGLHPQNRPIASFLFAGTTGVGKTQAAKVLAKELYGDEKSFIRFDMSEYQMPHEVAKLIGAPPGFIGFGSGGLLTEAVRQNPNAVILFDEIEKAHPKIYDLFLQIFDDGRLTDNRGQTVSFANTIIILTTNLGASQIRHQKIVGFNQQKRSETNYLDVRAEVMANVNDYFRPEFVNRLDEIIVFQPLTKDDIVKITELLVTQQLEQLTANGFQITFSPKTIVWLANQYYDPQNGARPIRRGIQRSVESLLANLLVSGQINKNQAMTIDIIGEKLVVIQEGEIYHESKI